MFKEVIIHYPTDEKIMTQINKELVAFLCAAAVKYIESLQWNDRQIEMLYDSLAEDIVARKQASKII